jgi:hypothetical protein
MDQKFEAVENSGLDCVKKEKMTENFLLFRYNPSKKDKDDDSEMASEIGEPGHRMIQNR